MPLKALITGASSGIGRAFAYALGRQGYALTLVARREQRLQNIANELTQGPGNQGPGNPEHRILVADLSQADDVGRVCDDIAAQNYDLLINNAGAGIYKPFLDASWDDIEANIRLNSIAIAKLSYQYLETAKAGDALINVASMVGFTPYPAAAVYGAAKAFDLSLSESLWHQYRDKNIYVMALCPGATDTMFFDAAGFDRDARPARRFMQTPEAVVDAGLQALKKRRQPTVIPGWHNMLFQLIMRLMNRKALVKAVGKFSN